jgi:hypothetical protein
MLKTGSSKRMLPDRGVDLDQRRGGSVFMPLASDIFLGWTTAPNGRQFALAYADQTERDHAALKTAAKWKYHEAKEV